MSIDRREGSDRRRSRERRRKERRGGPRHEVINLFLKRPIRGRILNASIGGMALETRESLNVGWSYAFLMGQGSETIRLPGQVAWCRLVSLEPSGNGAFIPVFQTGVRLSGSLWDRAQIHYYP